MGAQHVAGESEGVTADALGLLLGTRYLALHGASREQLRPARRLLALSSVMTLALNVADPLITDQTGKAAFEAVGPLLLIGWAEVGPGLLQAISGLHAGEPNPAVRPVVEQRLREAAPRLAIGGDPGANDSGASSEEPSDQPNQEPVPEDDLLEHARREDAWHWETYQRPISAETLRKRLRIGAARSRNLVATVRAEGSDRRSFRQDRACAHSSGNRRCLRCSSSSQAFRLPPGDLLVHGWSASP